MTKKLFWLILVLFLPHLSCNFFGVEAHMNMTTKLFRDLKDMAIQRLIGTECRGWKQCQTQDEVQELSCQTQWKSSKVWRWTRQAQILGSVLCLNVVFGSIFPCLSFCASVFHYSVFHYSVFRASVFRVSVFRSPSVCLVSRAELGDLWSEADFFAGGAGHRGRTRAFRGKTIAGVLLVRLAFFTMRKGPSVQWRGEREKTGE